MLQYGRKTSLTTAKLDAEVMASNTHPKKRKLDIEHSEALLDTNHAVKQLSFEGLGKRGGGTAVRNRRF